MSYVSPPIPDGLEFGEPCEVKLPDDTWVEGVLHGRWLYEYADLYDVEWVVFAPMRRGGRSVRRAMYENSVRPIHRLDLK